MFVREVGRDNHESILFLHGANAGGWMWENVVAHLPNYHCIYPDFPGHAKSRDLTWTSTEQVAQMAAECIVKKAHDGRAHVVGLSLGGYVTLHLLAQHSAIVKDAVISGVPSRPLPFGTLIKMIGYLLTPFIHSDWLLRRSARSLHVDAAELEEYVAHCKQNSKQAFREINRQAPSFVPPPTALQSTNRKLFIAGSREHPLIKQSLRSFNHAPATVCAEASGLGHGWSGEAPELFANTVHRWVQRQPLPDGLSVVPETA
ncbi:MAG: alpha/beta fold hydrolase [Pseudomonadota bacterium]